MSPAEAQQEIEKLIELWTPLDPTLTSDHHDRQLHAGRALVEKLSAAGEVVGIQALEAYGSSTPEDPVMVRVQLLEVGSHAAPERARPLLVNLVQEFGHHLADRTEAGRLLAETSPETALEVLTPLVERPRRTSTVADDEFLIRHYVVACEQLDVSPVPVLSKFVMNIYKQEAARHYAAEALGKYEDPLGIMALRALLVESSGNAYLRRKAAQSLRKILPAETACELFREIAEREADTGFLLFLGNMIEQNCE